MRFAFGGIHIECSTYSRISTLTEDFTVLSGEKLTSAPHLPLSLPAHVLCQRGSRGPGGAGHL
jgi:microcystin degradation protein MlrC